MTVEELYGQCLLRSPEERVELLCFVITHTVKEFGELAMDWDKELADRAAALSAGETRWLPSSGFMAKFRSRCAAA